jgi:hypothetical protein
MYFLERATMLRAAPSNVLKRRNVRKQEPEDSCFPKTIFTHYCWDYMTASWSNAKFLQSTVILCGGATDVGFNLFTVAELTEAADDTIYTGSRHILKSYVHTQDA